MRASRSRPKLWRSCFVVAAAGLDQFAQERSRNPELRGHLDGRAVCGMPEEDCFDVRVGQASGPANRAVAMSEGATVHTYFPNPYRPIACEVLKWAGGNERPVRAERVRRPSSRGRLPGRGATGGQNSVMGKKAWAGRVRTDAPAVALWTVAVTGEFDICGIPCCDTGACCTVCQGTLSGQ
jgi:hypothetical protein